MDTAIRIACRWTAFGTVGFGLAAAGGPGGGIGAILAAALAVPGLLLARCPGGCLRSLLWGVYPGAAVGLALMSLALAPAAAAHGQTLRVAAAVGAVGVSAAFAAPPPAGRVGAAVDVAGRAAIFGAVGTLISHAFNWL